MEKESTVKIQHWEFLLNLPTHRTLYPTTEKYILSSNVYGPLPENEPYAEPCHQSQQISNNPNHINYIFGHCVIKSELNKAFPNSWKLSSMIIQYWVTKEVNLA